MSAAKSETVVCHVTMISPRILLLSALPAQTTMPRTPALSGWPLLLVTLLMLLALMVLMLLLMMLLVGAGEAGANATPLAAWIFCRRMCLVALLGVLVSSPLDVLRRNPCSSSPRESAELCEAREGLVEGSSRNAARNGALREYSSAELLRLSTKVEVLAEPRIRRGESGLRAGCIVDAFELTDGPSDFAVGDTFALSVAALLVKAELLRVEAVMLVSRCGLCDRSRFDGTPVEDVPEVVVVEGRRILVGDWVRIRVLLVLLRVLVLVALFGFVGARAAEGIIVNDRVGEDGRGLGLEPRTLTVLRAAFVTSNFLFS